MTTPYRLRVPRSSGAVAVSDVLGPYLRSYRVDGAGHVIWAAAPFVLLLAYGVWLAHQGLLAHWFNSTFSVLAVAALVSMSIVLIAYTAAVGGQEVVHVHANGLLDLRDGRAVRWEEMRALTAIWDPEARCVDRHVLATNDGAQMTLARTIAGIDHLVDAVRVRMVEAKLGPLQERLAEGGFVRFGFVSARADGLATSERLLAWSDVGRIDAEGGEVIVQTRLGDRWAAAPMQDVPNAFLLAELAAVRAGK
jgi:hypothetical protein